MPIAVAFRQANPPFNIGQMMIHQLAGSGQVFCFQGADNLAVVVGAAVILALLFVQRHYQRQAGDDFSQHLGQNGVTRQLGQHDMELTGKHRFRFLVAVMMDLLLLIGKAGQRIQLFCTGSRHHERQQYPFQLAACFKHRRRFGQIVAGVAASAMLPLSLRAVAASGGTAVAATFPGNWEDAYRTVLDDILKKQGFGLTVSPAMAQDQLAKVMASPGNPPYDTLLMSPGQMTVAVDKGLIQKIDPSRLKNWNLLDPAFQGEYGPTVTVEVNGIAYNPELVPRPKGYADLFENPAYKGLVSWTGFGSNTAVMAYTEIAKIYGKGPDDMQAVFDLFRKHPEQMASIVDSTNSQMTQFQQGNIAVFMCSTNNVARLKSLGMKAEFVHPETGSPAAPVNIHLTKGSKNLDAAYAYMDAAISQFAQTKLEQPPTEMFPTNKNVELTPAIAAYITREQVKSLVYPDWNVINKNRDTWIRQFDALVAG